MSFLRTINTIDRSLVDLMLPAVTVPDSVATTVLDDSTVSTSPLVRDEIAYIELFNAGANTAYFAYGRDCDNATNFNGYVVAGQAVSIALRQRVSVFSAGGTVIARSVFKRLSDRETFV